MCFCVFLCVCVFEDDSFLGERVVGWGGATVGQQKAPPLPERERGREGPLPDPPLTAHAQATCLGTWSVALFL